MLWHINIGWALSIRPWSIKHSLNLISSREEIYEQVSASHTKQERSPCATVYITIVPAQELISPESFCPDWITF